MRGNGLCIIITGAVQAGRDRKVSSEVSVEGCGWTRGKNNEREGGSVGGMGERRRKWRSGRRTVRMNVRRSRGDE